MTSNLLIIDNLSVEYRNNSRGGNFRAVDQASFTIAPRETLGLVGESGSGKSTIGRAILGLTPAAEGTMQLGDTDISHLRPKEQRRLSVRLQAVFQDPYSSLNPARTIGQTLAESLRGQHTSPNQTRERVRLLLTRVGLPPEAAERYPRQFSGGQRQRIAIARALMVQPELVICDEAVSALDLSVQAQVLNLLRDLQQDFNVSYLFISHDLAVVQHVAHRIIVMYRGRIVESGSASTVYAAPAHPYSAGLIAAAPVPDPTVARAQRLPTATSKQTTVQLTAADSCNFAPRCPFATDVCRTVRPRDELTPEGTTVACHRWKEIRGELARVVAGPAHSLGMAS